MNNVEGVIKFRLEYTVAAAPALHEIKALNQWRDRLFRLRLIGQDPERYGGYGYGNVSCTLAEAGGHPDDGATGSGTQRTFLITGTQTGHLPSLGPEHYVRVTGYVPQQNRITAVGPVQPSSESLTHGAVYASAPGCNAVLHAHCPLLWHCARALGIPATETSVPYGTPEMADEVSRLFATTGAESLGIFAMGGHEDGIIAFGATLDEAGGRLIAMLTNAKLASIP